MDFQYVDDDGNKPIKVIETNIILPSDHLTEISLDDEYVYADFQSRIIDVWSWSEYVDEYKENTAVYRNNGSLLGYTVPKNCQINHLHYNSEKLECIIKMDVSEIKRLAYRVK